MNFFKKYKQYQIVFLLAGFTLFVIAWFWINSSGSAASNWTPNPAYSEPHAQAESPEFEPDGANVSPTTHNQLESLRLRVVNTPDDTTHIFRLARLLQDAHQPEEAARNYKHYLALHPENYQAWLDMTQSLGQAKLWKEALDAVNEMLTKYPDDPSALYNLGAVYANLGQKDEAIQTWQKIIQTDLDDEVAFLAKSAIDRLGAE